MSSVVQHRSSGSMDTWPVGVIFVGYINAIDNAFTYALQYGLLRVPVVSSCRIICWS